MKKRLLMVPLLGALMLTGCKITIFGKVIYLFEKAPSEKKDDEEQVNPLKEEFGDYKLAKSIKDGGQYLLGVYRTKYDTMRFINGDYHRANNKVYPFYMATTENTTEGAAVLTLRMESEDTFSLQVSAPGQVWDGKYIGAYSAVSEFGNAVMSIAPLDSPDVTTYTPAGGDASPCSGIFKYYKSYDSVTTYAPAIPFQYDGIDASAVPKFFGTGHETEQGIAEGKPDYTSVDCKSYEVALDFESYDLAHLYEHK